MIGQTTATPFVSALVLAAGASTRMGRPKLALPIHGEPMIHRVVRTALASRCRDVVVVLGTHAEVYRPLLDGLDVRIVMNPDPGEGMASSIRTGVAALSPEAWGVVILLADQPLVTAEAIDRLIAAAGASPRRIVASSVAGIPRPPVFFHRDYFGALQQLRGDQGARSLVDRHPQDRVLIPTDDAASMDIDVPDDLRGIGA
jgi:molybdenum cofactor cytidylyltransferase